MKKTLFLITAIFAFSVIAKAEIYRLNQSSVEMAFNQSESVDLSLLLNNKDAFNAAVAASEDDKQMIAGIVAFGATLVRFLGTPFAFVVPGAGLAIATGLWIASIVPWHRLLVLGTGGAGVKITALYCVTLGWCINAHHVIDGIMLLLEEDKSRFVGNPKYVMWAN